MRGRKGETCNASRPCERKRGSETTLGLTFLPGRGKGQWGGLTEVKEKQEDIWVPPLTSGKKNTPFHRGLGLPRTLKKKRREELSLCITKKEFKENSTGAQQSQAWIGEQDQSK